MENINIQKIINEDKLSIMAFDLDDTLAESKSPLDKEMSDLLCKLIKHYKIAVVSGASFGQFEKQFLSHFSCEVSDLKNLYLVPTNGSSVYINDGTWKPLYNEVLSETEKKRVFEAFDQAFLETNFEKPEKIYGVFIEDRGSQITMSALGSLAPVSLKQNWDPDHQKREKIARVLRRLLPDLSIGIGGTTSIDITKKGIDKAYGVTQLLKHVGLSFSQMLYVGDALFPGGNDAPVLSLRVHTFLVKGSPVDETKQLIREIINFSK